jgi:hypothetical protein
LRLFGYFLLAGKVVVDDSQRKSGCGEKNKDGNMRLNGRVYCTPKNWNESSELERQ